MIFTIRRLFVTQQNACILNRAISNSKSFTNCVRQLHILPNKELSLIGLYRLGALQTAYDSGNSSNQIVYTSIRFKSNKKNRNLNRSDQDDDDNDSEDKDDSDDDEKSNLDKFRQGDKASDKNLTEVKVQTLRLDTVIKAGLGFSKNKIEKLFYDSKIRLNGKKVTKKSMDIVKNCEIDVIKGPNEENSNFIDVGRIEILSIRSQGLFFVLTIRRTKNLTIENYEEAGRYTESE